jgi:F0F1-type ATP synthase membrane subunit c/vacuolar-type H+-ATPase subunit K
MSSPTMSSSKRKRRIAIAACVAAAYAVGAVVAIGQGYSFGLNVVARCRQDHLFTTVWIPGASVKAVRLGLWRVQWCPAGRHVALVHLVKDADLSESERAFAAAHRDVRVP